MKRLALLVLFAAMLNALAEQPSQSDGPDSPPPVKNSSNLSKIVLPEGDQKAATQTLKKWLTARSITCNENRGILAFRRGGVLINIHPFIFKDELDRLRMVAFFGVKEEYKKSEELEKFAAKMNKIQNFLTVFVDGDGDLAIGGNLTFVDELTAKEFDCFADLMAVVIQRYILADPDRKKLLK